MTKNVFAQKVKIGDITIGGKNKIAIQSMTNVPVGDILASFIHRSTYNISCIVRMLLQPK